MRYCLAVLLMSVSLLAQDTHCPAYPVSARNELAASNRRSAEFVRYRLNHPNDPRAHVTVPPIVNFIDKSAFGLMQQDGVAPAPLTNDNEFLRRIYLDLTGRIPTLERAQAFFADPTPDKRARLVDSLLASPAYRDQFSHWLLQRFQITNYQGNGWMGPLEIANFYDLVQQFVGADTPYDAFVRTLITASGDSDTTPGMAFLGRQYVTDGPMQDSWDAFTDLSTTQFLGVTTVCISCHNGQGHLENINLYLASHTRQNFWQLSAFFARTKARIIADDNAGFRPRLIFSDSNTGLYTGAVNPANPGARPARTGADESASYWIGNQQPQNGNWRQEFARLLTSDRQFARASANYIWAYFFGSGIVDPANGWDLNRLDPNNPPSVDLPVQNANPALLEALTDRFIQSNYSVKDLIRTIVNSNTYQLSSRYPGTWNDAYTRYFARHEARRLSAEQLVDSLMTATGTETTLDAWNLPGRLFTYANQLPYPGSSGAPMESLLDSLGRGDWVNQLPTNKPSLYGVLDFFNSWFSSVRTLAFTNPGIPQSRLSQWTAAGLTDSDILQRMFIATLTRPPTDTELQSITAHKLSDRLLWLSSVQWALLQKIDFVFNY